MRLMSIEIENFRGIKYAHVLFPSSTRIVCLIGPGDSGKSTLLKAIEWALWPSWSLIATDTDFYNSVIDWPIVIKATVGELPDELLKEDKFGLYQRDFDGISKGNDEPTDDGIPVLTIQLTVDSSLEPKWEIITSRSDPKPISQKDRQLLSFGSVGFDQERDFLWGRTSVLQKYTTGSKDALHSAFTEAMRSAVNNTNLDKLDEANNSLVNIGQQYGVSFNGELHNRLLMQNGSYSTTVGVFDDKVPFIQRGLGSKRLLSIGMNVNVLSGGSLVLIDEVETGLEPYRISCLINQLRNQYNDSGQVIMTTHSRSAVCECTVNELSVVDSTDGKLVVHPLNDVQNIKDDIQGIIRGEPDAFLSRRIIVCEGKTEIGLLRALDEKLIEKKGTRFAYYGVSVALGGGGDNFFKLARLLKKCGYDCCILMDSDIAKEEEEKRKVESEGIPVFSWELGNTIEEQLFKDVSIKCAEKLIAYAVEIKGIQSVEALLNNEFKEEKKEYIIKDNAVILCGDEQGNVNIEIMKRIGTVAKGRYDKKNNKWEGCWFKRIDRGQNVGKIIFSSPDQIKTGSCFKNNMNSILKWVTAHES